MVRISHAVSVLVTLLFIVLVGCTPNQLEADPRDADGWSQRYEGTTLIVLAEATANSAALEELIPEFEKKTGIAVELEQAPYDSVVQKSVLDFSAHRSGYDVVSFPYEYLGSFAEKDYIEPIDEWLDDPPAKIGPGFSTDALIPGLWRASSTWSGSTYGFPSNSAVMMMMYRKDLFNDSGEQAAFKQKYGYPLSPARTWDQYRDNAEFFTRDSGARVGGSKLDEPLYGTTLTGKRHVSTVLEWMNYAWGRGGAIFDEDGNLTIDSPENVEALEYELELTRFAPPGYTSATWDEVTALLQQGVAAQSITWGDTAGTIEDPQSSRAAGKIGYASMPGTDPKRPGDAHLGSWTYGINADSDNKEAAYLFMTWALSRPVQHGLAEKGGLPALRPTYEDSELRSEFPYWAQVLRSLQHARSRPRIPHWAGIADTLAQQLSTVLLGDTSPQEGLEAAQEHVSDVMADDVPITER